MRNYFYLPLLFLFANCQSQSIKNESANADSKSRSPIILRQSDKIYVETDVTVFSIDSVIATVTFVNDSTEGVVLYRPVLPSDTLIENSFSIMNKSQKNIKHFSDGKSLHKYYSGTTEILPAIIPIVNDNSTINLAPKQRLIFKINLSQHYDFRAEINEGINDFFIAYNLYVPLFADQKHVHELDSIDGKTKPVFLQLCSKKKSEYEFERKMFHVPSSEE